MYVGSKPDNSYSENPNTPQHGFNASLTVCAAG